MNIVNEVGLNSFSKLKKLRLENLEGTAFSKVYTSFIEQLRSNQTITFLKLENVFVKENEQLLILRDALKTSKVKKMVLWLARNELTPSD